jgi:hypothetical protein
MKLYSLTYFRFLMALIVGVFAQVMLSSVARANSIHPVAIASSSATLKEIGLNFDLASAPVARSIPTPARAIAVSSATGIVPPPPLQAVRNADSSDISRDISQADHPKADHRVESNPERSVPEAAIAFDLPDHAPPPPAVVAAPSDHTLTTKQIPVSQAIDASELFKGDSDSLVAKAVGSAEGTRTPEGERNPAYYGHVDPGNGAWNLGSFSYQHQASSPEEADIKQLRRLQTQTASLQLKAQIQGLELTLEQKLNGIDLANQAPQAALDRGGYIDRLVQAQQMGLPDPEAVLWARTRAFLDPDTQQWNAPGLGNNVYSIMHDQQRRQRAIARAIAAYQRQLETPGSSPLAIRKSTEDQLMSQNTITSTDSLQSQSSTSKASSPKASTPESAIDRLLHLDLSTANALQ